MKKSNGERKGEGKRRKEGKRERESFLEWSKKVFFVGKKTRK